MACSSSDGPRVTLSIEVSVSKEAIAELAYAKWLQRGKQYGNDRRDWYDAERDLRQKFHSAIAAS